MMRRGSLKEDEGRIELDRIRHDLDLVLLEKKETDAGNFNVRTAVSRCAQALKKPDIFWQSLKTVEQKQRFQGLVFPDGTIYENPGLRTA